WFGKIDANGLDLSGKSTMPLSTSFLTVGGAVAAGANPMTVASLSGATPRGFPWAIQPGMLIAVFDNASFANYELVTVTAINPAAVPPPFTATFAKAHAGPTFVASTVNFAFPNYPPTGYHNADPTLELASNPLSLNLYNPVPPNIASPSMSNLEALLRFGGTNAPPLTSTL